MRARRLARNSRVSAFRSMPSKVRRGDTGWEVLAVPGTSVTPSPPGARGGLLDVMTTPPPATLRPPPPRPPAPPLRPAPHLGRPDPAPVLTSALTSGVPAGPASSDRPSLA